MPGEDRFAAYYRSAVVLLCSEVKGVRAALIATSDGMQLAEHVEGDFDPARLAAVASSMAALGDLGSREADLGACHYVLIEAENGHVALCQGTGAASDLVVCALGVGLSAPGGLLYATRRVAAMLSRQMTPVVQAGHAPA